jgi:hypothetical protein
MPPTRTMWWLFQLSLARSGGSALPRGLAHCGERDIRSLSTGIILFAFAIPTRLGLSMEFSVGLMLIFLGLVNLKSAGEEANKVAHIRTTGPHNGGAHVEPHTHYGGTASTEFMDLRFGQARVYKWARPLIVGLVHGLVGSAAVALLVLTTLHDSQWAVAYLLVFSVGTVAGMMMITMAMVSSQIRWGRSAWINKRQAIVTGFLSVVIGLIIVYQRGIVLPRIRRGRLSSEFRAYGRTIRHLYLYKYLYKT